VSRAHAVALIGLCAIDVVVVFLGVVVDDGVTFIVVARTDEPTEDTRRMSRHGVGGVEDARVVVLPIQRGEVVARDPTPGDLSRCAVGPTLDRSERALEAGVLAWEDMAGGAGVVLERLAVGWDHWDQAFASRGN